MRQEQRRVAEWLPKGAEAWLFLGVDQSVRIAATIENAENDDGIGCNLKGDSDTAFEAGCSQTRANVVAAGASPGQPAQTRTPFLNSLDVSQRARFTVMVRDVIVQIEQVLFRFLAEQDLIDHADFFARSACRALTAAKTFSAGTVADFPARILS